MQVCTCAGGGPGWQRCEADETLSECVCAEDRPDACVAVAEEWCGHGDDDCDGIVDEGFVCPDDAVRHVVPFEGAVWLTLQSPAGESLLTRLEPAPFETHELERSAVWNLGFHRGVAHYVVLGGSRYELLAQAPGLDLVVPTPCSLDGFGFDALDRLYVSCAGTLFRDGTAVADRIGTLLTVLPSGQTIASGTDRTTLALFGADGSERTRFPIGEWVGDFGVLDAAVVVGEAAWVALWRVVHSEQEIVVFRVDGVTGSWDLVRRVAVEDLNLSHAVLPLPDGRVIAVHGRPPTSPIEVREYPVDGSPPTVWPIDSALAGSFLLAAEL